MTLNLMPAELVAKIAEDADMDRLGAEPMTSPPTDWMCWLVRHAWIVAAEALEEEALRVIFGEGYQQEKTINAAGVLVLAARALRKAAEEGREP